MTTTPASAWQREHGLGVLAARLLFAFQDELYARLHEAGHGKLTRVHGAVLAHIDAYGTRATELARRSRRTKQLIGRAVDELEQLGYVERRPEPGDRRAKLVVPTERGRELIRLSDQIIRDIEQRAAAALGQAAYGNFKRALATVADTLTPPASDNTG
jgi:DNA-binding MarR family transcriptional regulator